MLQQLFSWSPDALTSMQLQRLKALSDFFFATHIVNMLFNLFESSFCSGHLPLSKQNVIETLRANREETKIKLQQGSLDYINHAFLG